MACTANGFRMRPIAFGVVLFLIASGYTFAQNLEPRFLSAAPVGMNFVLLAYSNSDGNVLLDQSLPLEDTKANMHAITPAYARSIDFFGLSGRVIAVLPVATATWDTRYNDIDTSTTRTGIGDPLLGFAVNIIGAPPLKGKDFLAYKHSTTLGVSVKVRPPLGLYYPDRFFNLGTNRWAFSGRIGLSHRISRFTLEGYVNGWFFTANDDFYGGNTLEQDPLYSLQIHCSYQLAPGIWVAGSFGQSYGGATALNFERKDSIQKNNRWGLTAALPISRSFSFKLAYMSGITTRFGANFAIALAALQYRWGGL